MAWGHVVLTPAQEKEYAKPLPPVPVTYIGVCAACSRKIPAGYVPMVTEWSKVEKGGLVLSKPKTMYCRACSGSVEGEKKKRYKRPEHSTGMTLKDIAMKIYPVLPVGSKGYGSKKLARLAGIGWCPEVRKVLRKLREAGKVVLVEGKWRKNV